MSDWVKSRWRAADVAVLYGGSSNEREISLKTGAAIAAALEREGIMARLVDFCGEAIAEFVSNPPDVAFIALHGAPGEDGSVQGLLELLDIPYTGSGVQSSSICIDKVASKRLLDVANIPTPAWHVAVEGEDAPVHLGWPMFIKPSLEGSSVGAGRVTSAEDWPAALETTLRARGEALVEAFVSGRELTVGVFEDEILGVVEIRPGDGFYDFDAKYVRGDTEYLIPAPLDEQMEARVLELARKTYDELGCRGVARVDVLLSDEGPFVLEVNTVPGMTESSLVPKLAEAKGERFGAFCVRMLNSARTDKSASVS